MNTSIINGRPTRIQITKRIGEKYLIQVKSGISRYGFPSVILMQHLYLRIDTPQHARFYFEQGYTLDIVMMSMNDYGNDKDKDKDKKKRVISLKDLNTNENIAIDIFIECKIPLTSIPIKEGEYFYLYLEWKSDGSSFQTIPPHGYFTLTVPTVRDYARFWLV
jgi:hypothetical protein